MSSKLATAGLVLLTSLVLVGPTTAEISKVGPQQSEVVAPGARLRVQCFQQGVKIMDEDQLEAINVSPSSRSNSLTFKRRGQEGVAVMVFSLDETACVVAAPR